MRDETRELVEIVESHSYTREDSVLEARGLWNYEQDQQDCDVELRIGTGAYLAPVLGDIEEHSSWTLRYLGTPESDSEGFCATAAFIHHDDADVSGVLRFDSVELIGTL